jgi:hypothetical protein
MPVEIRRTIVPPNRAALAEQSFDVVNGSVRGGFGLRIDRFLSIAYRPPGRHQPANEIGSRPR